MAAPKFETFDTPVRLQDKVRARLEKKPEIFTFESDPHLASLISCLGIQHDLNKKEWDRLSAPLNQKGSWNSQLIAHNGEIGLCLSSDDVQEFKPDHPDFKYLLHPLSLDENGRLSRLVFFPNLIAQTYKNLGIELTIVKQWALSSFLSPSVRQTTNYLLTNTSEISDGTALLQARILSARQIALQGTHDMADHLLGGHGEGLSRHQKIYDDALECMERHFYSECRTPHIKKLLIYTAGVVLDDMAQPKWYSSENHLHILKSILAHLEGHPYANDIKQVFLPTTFHRLMAVLRDSSSSHIVDRAFNDFILSLTIHTLRPAR